MRARNSSRRKLAEARANRRAVWKAALAIVAGLGLAALLISTAPQFLPAQAIAAQVLRGETLNLSIGTETNLPALTNHPVAGTSNIGLPPATAVTNAPLSAIIVDGAKYSPLSFASLASFRFNVTDEMSRTDANPVAATMLVLEQIPPEVKRMNQEAVAVTGFMLPVRWNEGLVTDFMLLPNTMSCCYGRVPRINEVVIVNTTGKGVQLQRDIPVSVCGTFRVGAIRNNNYLVGIYQMDCERVVEGSALKTR